MSISVNKLIEKLQDPQQEITLIRQGIKTNDIESFLHQRDLPVKDILSKLAIPSSTYFARKKNHKRLDACTSEKFIRLISVMELAIKILGKVEAKKWLYREIPSLGNAVPLNLLDTETGHRLVTQALHQIEYGIYG